MPGASASSPPPSPRCQCQRSCSMARWAIFDQHLRSRFDLLRHADPDVVATPPVYITFDLLYRDGIDVSGRPLHERRAHLEEIVTGGDRVPGAPVATARVGSLGHRAGERL